MQSLLTVENSDSSSDDDGDCDDSHSIGEPSSAQSHEAGSQSKVYQRSSLYTLLKNEDVSITTVYLLNYDSDRIGRAEAITTLLSKCRVMLCRAKKRYLPL